MVLRWVGNAFTYSLSGVSDVYLKIIRVFTSLWMRTLFSGQSYHKELSTFWTPHFGRHLGFLPCFLDISVDVGNKKYFLPSVILVPLGLFLSPGLFESSGCVYWFLCWFRCQVIDDIHKFLVFEHGLNGIMPISTVALSDEFACEGLNAFVRVSYLFRRTKRYELIDCKCYELLTINKRFLLRCDSGS